MSTTSRSITAAALIALAAGVAGSASAQLASKVSGARDGSVRFTFQPRPEVCGSGNSVSTDGRPESGNWYGGRYSEDVEWDTGCERGPVRMVLAVNRGTVNDIHFYVGGKWRQRTDVTDLGEIAPQEAADYLLSIAQSLPPAVGKKAIFPATLANGVTVWPTLVKMARNNELPESTRRDAVFWLGQMAGVAATKNLAELAGEDTLNRGVRESAVFALSQQRDGAGVDALIKIAQTNRDPEVRKRALFWLGQSKDPRALDLFEKLLAGR